MSRQSSHGSSTTRRGKSSRLSSLEKLGGYLLLALLVGIPVLVGIRQIRAYKRTKAFAATSGTILGKKLTSYSTRGASTNTFYVPEILYRYKVGDRTYVGNIYQLNLMAGGCQAEGGSKRWALSVLKRYRQGQTVTVYYDPQNPECSVLKRGINKLRVAAYLIGAPLFVLAMLAADLLARRRRRSKNQL